ncbi:hypothetical protein EV363DRAFT_9119 [Boletus edulis]|nr:hypothetical protein EV363DRAFT_9119 [Boletus edulis]
MSSVSYKIGNSSCCFDGFHRTLALQLCKLVDAKLVQDYHSLSSPVRCTGSTHASLPTLHPNVPAEKRVLYTTTQTHLLGKNAGLVYIGSERACARGHIRGQLTPFVARLSSVHWKKTLKPTCILSCFVCIFHVTVVRDGFSLTRASLRLLQSHNLLRGMLPMTPNEDVTSVAILTYNPDPKSPILPFPTAAARPQTDFIHSFSADRRPTRDGELFAYEPAKDEVAMFSPRVQKAVLVTKSFQNRSAVQVCQFRRPHQTHCTRG